MILDADGEVDVVAGAVDSEKALMRTSLGVWTAVVAVEGSSVTHSVTVAIQAVALVAREENNMAVRRMRIFAVLRAVYADILDEDVLRGMHDATENDKSEKERGLPNTGERGAVPTFPLTHGEAPTWY